MVRKRAWFERLAYASGSPGTFIVSHPGQSIRQWYNTHPVFMPGTLFVVATPIGNLEDISARALRVLREVALIAAEDTRRTHNLLTRYGITTGTTSLHEHNERAKTNAILDRLKRGEDVALVSDAGTPTVSDPGELLIKSAIEAGVRVEPVPGPNAAIATLSVSGLSSGTFTFMGFPPTRASDRAAWFEKLRTAGHTVVFYEAPHRLLATLEELQRVVGDRPAVVGRELTKAHEELVRGPISDLRSNLHRVSGEFTVVVDIGLIPEIIRPEAFDAVRARAEFGDLTNNGGLTRRQAISRLSKRHAISAKRIYELLEATKPSSGE
jgi:16S rRNA (cytidine1402-2'-O)-methyltransferase